MRHTTPALPPSFLPSPSPTSLSPTNPTLESKYPAPPILPNVGVGVAISFPAENEVAAVLGAEGDEAETEPFLVEDVHDADPGKLLGIESGLGEESELPRPPAAFENGDGIDVGRGGGVVAEADGELAW